MEKTLKNFIKTIISGLKKVADKLSSAYDETWGIEELTQEFSSEVKDRKEYNKEKTIEVMALDIAKNVYKKHNIMLKDTQARRIAIALFDKAKRDGVIDELNNIIE